MELIKPMEPILSTEIIEDKDFIHQIKWDGIRGITYIDNDTHKVFTKNGNERTDYYPELNEINHLFNGRSGIIDGEIIVLDDNLRPTFNYILNRERVRNQSKIKYYANKYPIKYIAFDILLLDGKDLRSHPLEDRIEILHKTLNKSGIITITDSFDDGRKLYELMEEKNYEGIVSKNINSKYIAGKKHDMWYKTKIFKKMLTAIGGIQLGNGKIKSLLLGIYSEGNLIYIGNASIGLKESDYNLLKEYMSVISMEESTFTNIDKDRNVIWIKPILTCWVSFLEWTNTNSLRHPKIIGFSSKKATEAIGEEYTYRG
ncbi:ATP-dependent DNA ligase [Vallitalea guaymasensis]|uniref:DNA ligase (ATP) n=1 Tax=Vallitalea guaymasensis TaxID=1185412 RepID=A0A8J8ME58_9FIRM|nr:RNA ligase family protein [Vallitalea guaymasensis]QUH31257.1 ATP-dependent DNA ligase [Vallitalea guaymasensis]